MLENSVDGHPNDMGDALPANAVHPLTRQQWREWLAEQHQRVEGVWFVTYKRQTGKPWFDFADAVAEALCFGWIDSKVKSLDAERTMYWFAPRRAGTGWSRQNKQLVETLIVVGLMSPSGLTKIEAARADGSWNALDSVEAIELPPDLESEFARFERAAANFAAFPRSAKRAILAWIASAKRPETRAKRIEQAARLADQNIRAIQ